jgi:hypothetical protein
LPQRSAEKVARVALISKIKSQCFQTLEEEVHNERLVTLGRKNWTFAGSDAGGERAAALYTLVETAKLNGLDPEAYLRDVIGRIADHPINRIADLLPWNITAVADRAPA